MKLNPYYQFGELDGKILFRTTEMVEQAAIDYEDVPAIIEKLNEMLEQHNLKKVAERDAVLNLPIGTCFRTKDRNSSDGHRVFQRVEDGVIDIKKPHMRRNFNNWEPIEIVEKP